MANPWRTFTKNFMAMRSKNGFALVDHCVAPILYSFRRCPYAIRARLALQVSGLAYEHREVVLKNKPASMLALSPKGTVPVLWLPNATGGEVIDQSLDIMLWALRQHDPQGWLPAATNEAEVLRWIAQNDGPFKQHLDRYKYPQRSGLTSGVADRDLGAQWLAQLNERLQQQAFLAGARWGLLDAALAPFVRQFAHTDPAWFADQPWPRLIGWLSDFENSPAFAQVMAKQPAWQDPVA
jgi:glutathione S-transferase